MLNRHLYSELKIIMMNRKLLTTILPVLLLQIELVYPQNGNGTQTLSYDQAISAAVQNNPDLKIKELEYLISVEKLNESKLSLIPEIHGRYDIQRNLIIPSTLVPVGKFNPALPDDELAPIKFGTNWSSGLGLVASVKLLDPQVIGDIREKRASLSVDDIERKISRIDIEIETGRAYASCLISYQQLRFAVDDTVNSYSELTESESKYSEGYLKLTDLNQVILNHRNTVSHYNEALKILKDSRETLYFLMGIEDLSGSDFVLADSLETLISRFSIDADYTEIDESLTEARLDALRDVEKIRLGNVKAGFIPEISLSGLYGSDFYNNRLILGDDNYWFGNSSVNLSMRIPLTEGIGRTKKITQQKYLIDVKGEELTAAMNQKELEKDRAIQDIEFYRKEAGIKKSNLDLAEENYEAAFSQFSEGRILQSELLQSELLLKQIKVDYLNAVYNYIDSLLNLRRIIES